MTVFRPGEQAWIERFGKVRNVVRQELIARQLTTSIGKPAALLDVGCGQGEQARRLLATGWTVTGVDPSEKLLDSFRSACSEPAPELIAGGIEDLDELIGQRVFDLVCAHGLLMYLEDRTEAIRALAERVAPNGLLSLTFRNADCLAMRPGIRQDWSATNQAFGTSSYTNELGLRAQAHRLGDIDTDLERVGLVRTDWFGVRVFHRHTLLPPNSSFLTNPRATAVGRQRRHHRGWL